MKDYLKSAWVKTEKAERGADSESVKALRILLNEKGRKGDKITANMRKGYKEAVVRLPFALKVVFQLRVGTGLPFAKIAAVCRGSNSIKDQNDTKHLLPATTTGVRRAYVKAVNELTSPKLWYLVESASEAEKEEKEDEMTLQAVKVFTTEKIDTLPKYLQDALRRNGIKSLNDKRLEDPNHKFIGIGPKKMEIIRSYMRR